MLQAQPLIETINIQDQQITDADGYLINTYDWNRLFTQKRAQQASISLNDKHWQLIDLIRDKYLNLGVLPPMRLVCKAVGFEKKELKQQFGSCLNLWKIAGLPNPGEEVIAHMN